jgi:hypothetical protein
MNLYFLSASEPLTKTHTKVNSHIDTQNYPMMKYFTSHQETINNTEEFYYTLLNHAQLGHCLLKGELKKPLNNESRSDSVNRLALTNWLIFDLDGAEYEYVENFLCELPSEFIQADYIQQWSASAGIKGGLKVHLFFLLDKPTSPTALKLFLTELNLNIPVLQNSIYLNPGNLSLGFTLDTGVNANSTPIYIAPPICVGFDDPIQNRISFHKGNYPTVKYNFTTDTAKIETAIKNKIKELRSTLGLPKKSPKTKTVGNIELLTNADPALLTGEPFEERGFIYVPINPNNKYTYYHPIDNPSLIHNFKGEPAVRTEQLLPDYWKALRAQPIKPESNEEHTLIFRDPKTDTYYNGWSSHTNLEIYATKNKDRLKDFATQKGLILPDPIPDWNLDFDPTSEITLDIPKRYLNLFRLSSYLKKAIHEPKKVDQIPPTIYNIIDSVTGNDETCREHFINWLAYIIQKRKKTKTAWIFQGVEGTGKGILFHLILRPILGPQYCHEKLLKDLLDNFNDWARESLLVFFDETKHWRRSDAQKNLPNLIKNLITEPVQNIRAMRTNAAQFNSYTNCLFATNESDSLYISESDRRFNVCPEQLIPYIPPADLEQRILAELQDFTHFLYNFPVVEMAVRTALDNTAKVKLRDNASSEMDLFLRAFKKGDFEYFADIYEENMGMVIGNAKVLQHIIEAWAMRWMTKDKPHIYIRRDELLTVFNITLNINDITRKSFTHLLHKKNIQTEKQRIEGKIKDKPEGIKDDFWGPTTVIPVIWQTGLEQLETIYKFIEKTKVSNYETGTPKRAHKD